jgi:hypothetical protein
MRVPSRARSFWESSPPMGLFKGATGGHENQGGRRKRLAHRPRMRRCLLKGCEQRFRPRQARQRYCSQGCRESARKWARRKAQLRYRATKPGKQKRNGQSQRYRERVRSSKTPEPEAVAEAARVIPNNFFRRLLRPAWLLRKIRARTAKSLTTLLFAGVPACAGVRPTAGTALETSAHLIRTY